MCVCVSDGLTDCVDPDCCQQASCSSGPLCQGSPDPLDLVQQSQTPFALLRPRLFFDRVRFLVGKASTHVLPGDLPFDSRCASPAVRHSCATSPNALSLSLWVVCMQLCVRGAILYSGHSPAEIMRHVKLHSATNWWCIWAEIFRWLVIKGNAPLLRGARTFLNLQCYPY